MLRRRTQLKGASRSLTWLHRVASCCVAALGGSLKANPAEMQFQLLAAALEGLRQWAWILIPSYTAIAFLAAYLKKISDPMVPDFVRCLLNEMEDALFADEASLSRACHQVTLFRYHGGEEKGILIPYERSGELGRLPTTRFNVDRQKRMGEGVAGQAFVTRRTVYPIIPQVSSKPTNAELKAYAKATWINHGWAQERVKNRPLPKAMCGIPVEVSQRTWGAIVISSQSGVLPDQSEVEKIVQAHAKSLNELLQKV